MVLDSVACSNVSFSENHAFYCFLVHEEFLTIDIQSSPYWSNSKQPGPGRILIPHWKLLFIMGIPILARRSLYIETVPCFLFDDCFICGWKQIKKNYILVFVNGTVLFRHFWPIILYKTYRDHLVNAPSQWETTLQCNVVSHWLGAFTKRSLKLSWIKSQ